MFCRTPIEKHTEKKLLKAIKLYYITSYISSLLCQQKENFLPFFKVV